MINKIADEAFAILLFICSHEVWVKLTYDWSTALCLCLCLCLCTTENQALGISAIRYSMGVRFQKLYIPHCF